MPDAYVLSSLTCRAFFNTIFGKGQLIWVYYEPSEELQNGDYYGRLVCGLPYCFTFYDDTKSFYHFKLTNTSWQLVLGRSLPSRYSVSAFHFSFEAHKILLGLCFQDQRLQYVYLKYLTCRCSYSVYIELYNYTQEAPYSTRHARVFRVPL